VSRRRRPGSSTVERFVNDVSFSDFMLGFQESKVTALADTVQAGQFVDRLWRWRSQLQERISASENSASMELGDVFEHAFSELLPAYHAWAKNFQAAAAMYLALEAVCVYISWR
jgi:hypothetical protein